MSTEAIICMLLILGVCVGGFLYSLYATYKGK